MSQRNVDLAYRATHALGRRDVEEFISYFDPNAELQTLLEMEGTYRGHDAIRRWYANLNETFGEWMITLLEVRDLGDRVLAQAHLAASGATSGLGIDETYWYVAWFRRGRCVRYAAFRTEEEARADVGPRE